MRASEEGAGIATLRLSCTPYCPWFLLARVVINNGLAIDYRILAEDGVGDIVVFALVT
jgi:hypothetical protein